MNLQDLRYAVAVDDHRHFGRAAEACFVSQPTLSSQLRKLEDELGVALFERAPRNVMPTAVGRLILHHARGVLVEVDQIEALAKAAAEPGAATLQIGVFPTLAPYFLPRIVPAIHAELPRLRLILLEEKTELLLSRLRRGQIDMALLALPVAGDDLHGMRLFDEPFHLAVSDRHRLAGCTSVSAADLEQESLLLLDDGHCLRDQALEFCRNNAVGESREFRATSLETLIQMVATDMGITLVPEMAIREAPRHLRFIPFSEPGPHRTIGLVWRRKASQHAFFEQIGTLMCRFRDGA